MSRHFHTIRLTFAGSLGVLLLVLMVFSGVLRHLPARKSHLAVGAAGDLLGVPSETKPSRPLHYKRATMVKYRTLLRFQHMRAKTAKLCSVVAVHLFELRSSLPADPDLTASRAGHRTTGARAPPFA